MATIAYRVPCLYSLVQGLLFVWWQNTVQLYPGLICTQIPCMVRRAPGLPAHYLQSPLRPSGRCIICGGFFVQGASAFSPGCCDVRAEANVVVPWAAWFGSPLLQLLALMVVRSLYSGLCSCPSPVPISVSLPLPPLDASAEVEVKVHQAGLGA